MSDASIINHGNIESVTMKMIPPTARLGTLSSDFISTVLSDSHVPSNKLRLITEARVADFRRAMSRSRKRKKLLKILSTTVEWQVTDGEKS